LGLLHELVGKPSNKDGSKFYCVDGNYDTSDGVLMSVEGDVPVIDANNVLNIIAQGCLPYWSWLEKTEKN